MAAATVRIPMSMRDRAGGLGVIDVDTETVGGAVDIVCGRYPQLGEFLREEDGSLHRHVNFFLRDEDVRYLEGLATPVADGDEITVIPAVAGGSDDVVHQPDPPGAAGVRMEFGPLPTSTDVQPFQTHEGARVLVVLKTPQGINGYFLSPDHARALAEKLTECAAAAGSGLVLPRSA